MNPEQSQPTPIPTLGEVNAAYADIVEHNRQHASMGAGLANLFKALVESSDIVDSNDVDDSDFGHDSDKLNEHIEKAVTEGDMHGELQDIMHGDTFMRIGVEVNPIGDHVTNGLHERTTSTSLVPRIANTEIYKDFLGTLKPEDVEKDEDQSLLVGLLGSLRSTVDRCFDPSEKEKIPEEMQDIVTEAGEDALRTYVAIAPEYERLGLNSSSPFETMEDYVSYWGRDVLPEYIVARKSQYLTAPEDQGFGPAQWHYDGGQRFWGSAIEFVAGLAQNGRTRDFAEEVRKGLVRSLDTAIEEIDNSTDEEPLYFAGQRGDLANVKDVFTGQDFDEKRLKEYTKDPYQS